MLDTFYKEFNDLESNNNLDIENNIHKFSLQLIYLDIINDNLEKFVIAWNNHRIRTASRRSPRQIWLDGVLENVNSEHTAIRKLFSDRLIQFNERLRIISC